MNLQIVRKYPENFAFALVTAANMLPFVATRFFPSMDGPAHLANANIINQLLFHGNDLFHSFFEINPEPVPNWTGHLVISLLSLVMPAFLAEKVLIVTLLTGIPYAFRKLLTGISPANSLLSFLIFPFTHSMFFIYGFFNFCIAILFFLITLQFWLSRKDRRWTVGSILLTFLLVSVTYFSHVVVFGVLLILIAVYIIVRSIMILRGKIAAGPQQPVAVGAQPMVTGSHVAAFRYWLKNAAVITCASAAPLGLFIYFLISRPSSKNVVWVDTADLFGYLTTVRPLIALDPSKEGHITALIFYLLLFIFGAALYLHLYKKNTTIPEKETGKQLPQESNEHRFNTWWLSASSVALLLLYFFIPDEFGKASYTNLRVALLFFITLILLLSTFRLAHRIAIASAVVMALINFMLIYTYLPSIWKYSRLAIACNNAANHITDNSLVLPVYTMNNWFTGHFTDYLAIDRPIVMAYNYECELGYFPVRWNEKDRPDYFLGNPADTSHFIEFRTPGKRPAISVGYIFVLGSFNPDKGLFYKRLFRIIRSDFETVYQERNCTLYRNKRVYSEPW